MTNLKNIKNIKIIKKENIVYLSVFIVATVLLICKIFISSEITLKDESQYITTAFRYVKGDVMLIHEWSVVQTSSFLLIPFWWIWNLFSAGSTEGIIIYFRFIYLLFKIGVFIYSLFLTKGKEYRKYVFWAGMVFYCFSPQNIDALSYNTIGLGMIYLIMLYILVDSQKKRDYMICGGLFAIAVFVQPYNLLLYLGYFITVILIEAFNLYRIKNNKESLEVSSFFSLKGFLWFSISPALMVLLMVIYFGMSASLGDVIVGLKNTLNEPDHVSDSGLIGSFRAKLVHNVDTFFKDYLIINIVNIIWLGVLIVGRMKKKFFSIGTIYLLLLSCISVAIIEKSFPMNILFFVFFWFSLQELVLIRNMKTDYYICMIISLGYSLCVMMGTNTGVISASAAMAAIAFIDIIIWAFVSEDSFIKNINDSEHKMLKTDAPLLLLTVLVLMLRMIYAWTDICTPSLYNAYLDRGPLKGTYTKKEVKDHYDDILSDMDKLECREDDILLCGCTTPVAYLYTKADAGVMAVYFFNMNYEWLDLYYDFNPEKMPSVIYYEKANKRDRNSDFIKGLSEDYEILECDKKILARTSR